MLLNFILPLARPPHRLHAARVHNRPVTRVAARAVAASPHRGRDRSLQSGAEAAPWAASPACTRHILTLLASAPRELQKTMHTVRALVEARGAHMAAWRQLGDSAQEAVVQLPATDVDALQTELFRIGRKNRVDAVLQEESVVRSGKRLAVFDLDSTLIRQETIDELASELDVQTEVMHITERAMNGEIGFREALAARVALLKGLPVQALDGVMNRVVFTPGAKELVTVLSALGCETAVISGGFRFLADHVRDVLGLDFAFANSLEDHDGILTGRTVGEVVDAEFKQKTLQRLADERGLRPEEVLAVGDGSNDLLMMGSAGLGVAFNAKPIVQDKAKCRVNQVSLVSILYLLGLSDEEMKPLLRE